MTLLINSSDTKSSSLTIPDVHNPCTVSIAVVDYMTEGKADFCLSRQWSASEGLLDSSIELGGDIILKSKKETSLIFEVNNCNPTFDKFLMLVVTINFLDDTEIYRFSDECIYLPHTLRDIVNDLSSSQFSGDSIALLSFKRFMQFANNTKQIKYDNKKILLSGCGTGSEALVCINLGAKICHGDDIDVKALDFARLRFKNNPKIKFFNSNEDNKNRYDLIISRHVLEHIEVNDWPNYLLNLSKKLNASGKILLDVPNNLNPKEPHTDILFFHLLNDKQKSKIIKYLDLVDPIYYQKIKTRLKALVNHKNVSLTDLKKKLPQGLKILTVEYVDMNSSNYHGNLADNIYVMLGKIR